MCTQFVACAEFGSCVLSFECCVLLLRVWLLSFECCVLSFAYCVFCVAILCCCLVMSLLQNLIWVCNEAVVHLCFFPTSVCFPLLVYLCCVVLVPCSDTVLKCFSQNISKGGVCSCFRLAAFLVYQIHVIKCST